METNKNKVVELINAVEEKNLSKEQLERYYDELSILFARMQMESADIEKVEAVFFAQKHQDLSLTDVAIKRQWKASELGQKGIELRAWSKGIEKLLRSVKNRIYSLL